MGRGSLGAPGANEYQLNRNRELTLPTYEYRCPERHVFEKFQRMSDPPEAECPECGQPAERMLSGGGGFLFKGEGFYITDYRSDSYKKAAEKDRSGGAKSGGSKGESGSASGTDSGSGGESSSSSGSSSASKGGSEGTSQKKTGSQE